MEYKLENVTVHSVGQIESRSSNGRTFSSLPLTVSWMPTYQNAKMQVRLIEVPNKKFQEVQGLQPGMQVSIEVFLGGNSYQDHQTGAQKAFNKDRLKSIQVLSGGGYNNNAPQGQAQPQQNNTGGYAGGTAPQQNFQQPNNQGFNQGFQGAGDPVDDIPF